MPTTTTTLPILYRPTEVASLLGISRSQIYVLMNRGELASLHVGRCRRISHKHIDEFIDNLATVS
jgi:excisionase family DNA binding protein